MDSNDLIKMRPLIVSKVLVLCGSLPQLGGQFDAILTIFLLHAWMSSPRFGEGYNFNSSAHCSSSPRFAQCLDSSHLTARAPLLLFGRWRGLWVASGQFGVTLSSQHSY